MALELAIKRGKADLFPLPVMGTQFESGPTQPCGHFGFDEMASFKNTQGFTAGFPAWVNRRLGVAKLNGTLARRA
ncbi:hypothetical protein CCP4SC76_5650004 [Gammaproteobacteria bacterium]